MKTECFGDKWIEFDLPFPCEIHWSYPRSSLDSDATKVLAIHGEPKALTVDETWLIQNHKKFDLIITWDKNLTSLSNARLLAFGGCWCNQPPQKKEFSVSFVLSTGCSIVALEGYALRKEVAFTLEAARIPLRLYLSRRLTVNEEDMGHLRETIRRTQTGFNVLGDKKNVMMESMFSIAIENTRVHEGFFTEKLIDCMRTYTVPIYYGPDSVLDIFNPEGIIVVKSAKDINRVLVNLTERDYWRRLSAMSENYKIAEEYMDILGRTRELILREIAWSL